MLATHATLRMMATMPFDGPLQTRATIAALFERNDKPNVWSKTQRGMEGAEPALSQSGPVLSGSQAGNGAQLFLSVMSEAR
jgi:hypothetical protein